MKTPRDIARWRANDSRENEWSSPPDSEVIAWHSTWLCEFYLPSHAAQLADRLKKLGWKRAYGGAIDSDPLTFRDGRTTGGSAFLCELVGEKAGREPMFDERVVDEGLPVGVDMVRVSVRSITRSTTAIIFQFVLNASARASIEKLLRRSFPTHLTPYARGHLVHKPRAQKAVAVADRMRAMHRACGRFVSDRVPGAVAAGVCSYSDCAMDVVLTKEAKPFTSAADVMTDDYRRVLGIVGNSPFVVLSNELPDDWVLDVANHSLLKNPSMTLWGQLGESLPGNSFQDGELNSDNLASAIAYPLEPAFSLHSCGALLDGYHRVLAGIRDDLPEFGESIPDAIDQLSKVENEIETRLDDGSILAEELSGDSASGVLEASELLEWKWGDSSVGNREPPAQQWPAAMVAAAESLVSLESHVRDRLQLSSDLAALRLQLKLQQQTKWITLGALVFALIAIIIGLAQIGIQKSWI